MTFEEWMRAVLDRVETALDHYLPAQGIEPAQLHEAMRYAVMGGGKRVRPLLCHAAGELTGAQAASVEAASAALEMIHVYSLVHDDMPCMDDDALRRGKPTVHVKYDEATALLVGDALQSQAFVALTADVLTAAQQAALVRELALASGSVGMAGGQAIDLASVGHTLTRPQLETMHRKKTGALLRAAVRMGALAGTAPDAAAMSALDAYAAAVGLAFQVVDDILDVTTDSATLGKTAGKDAKDGKPTYVSIIGLDASRALAAQLRADAHAALAPFGARAQRLAELADLVVNRVS
ncbi:MULTISPECIES: polyprenyl synthetase family protein [Paraburkholderia]|uniref:polyprenyl synthetase family protein n=1 Tax=Paraburkholderia TaxID=1822464 RepID=UPI002258870D|nr:MULTISPECIES: farnesyl diphosphate synthase [Paraburkholderia]MCX4164021.1 polyprenyl synthetase family protein [Paraburkholderia megapolitana]MDN7159516.1 polyprenyl synthetase family protein [Paraburkholderia sp. CHISQ3]MDQ6496563.1 polyprenyl synthetase family protein [Paraburkholderia megapolitana]